MSKSAKLVKPKRSVINLSSYAERKLALSIIKDVQPDAGTVQTRRWYTAEEKIRIII
ncbi:hypothetical protein GCM10027185_61660 [Spirosoma pulveris]